MIISFSRRIAMLFYFILTISLCCSLAILPKSKQSPLQHTSQRRRIVPQNNNNNNNNNNDNVNIDQSVPSVLFSSSDNNNNDSSNDSIVDAINHDKDTTIQNTSTKSSITTTTVEDEKLSIWPQNDELDKRMMKIALPCIANFAINPLIGAVDLFWVNRMGSALAVAGQAAGKSAFVLFYHVISCIQYEVSTS